MLNAISDQCDVVILTALRIEYLAMRAHLVELSELQHKCGNVYERGTLAAAGRRLNAAIVETGKGNGAAARETERAVSFFCPTVAFFVGIAGGVKDVALGDVVAAAKVYGYESGREDTAFRSRPMVFNSSYPLQQRASAEARKSDWLNGILKAPKVAQPRVFVAPIASGEKLLASRKSLTYERVRNVYNDAVAVDMEACGFLEALHAFPGVQGMVVRGVSDLIHNKKQTDGAGWQETAASHACAFVVQLLTKIGDTRLPILRPEDRQTLSHKSTYSAARTMQALLDHYSDEAVADEIIRQYTQETERIARRAWLVSACKYIPGSRAEDFLHRVVNDAAENELVILEARRALENRNGK